MITSMRKYFDKYLYIIRNNIHLQLHEVFDRISLPMNCKYDFILDMKTAMHGTQGTIITYTKSNYNYSFIYGFMYRYKTNVYFCLVRSSDRKHRFVTSSIITPIIVGKLITDNIISEEFAYE